MAKYTTEVRSICESLANWDNQGEIYNNAGYNNISDIIEIARPKIFDFDYPIFDTSYKATLETKILMHFYFREIGAESYGMWKTWLNRRMVEIMPYFNKLYKSELLDFNPFYNTEHVIQKDSTDTHDRVNTGNTDSVNFNERKQNTDSTSESKTHAENETDENSEGTNKNTRSNWEAFSDTPQGGLEGIASNRYLTTATHTWTENPEQLETKNKSKITGESDEQTDVTQYVEVKGSDKTQNSSQISGKEIYTGNDKYLEYVLGKEGTETYSEMLDKYRKTFLNIDMMVIEKLNDLFFNLW